MAGIDVMGAGIGAIKQAYEPQNETGKIKDTA